MVSTGPDIKQIGAVPVVGFSYYDVISREWHSKYVIDSYSFLDLDVKFR